MGYQHASLAQGRWHQMSLAEQMGNIGSEISRAYRWEGKERKLFEGAFYRALELFDLTLADPRWQKARRLKEIARAREIVCDAYFGGHEYGSRFEDLRSYFDHFAIAARPAA
ncbi:MAG: hypothetical protein HY547_07115 [Elusimicrobia bacterium]|nr:hypothetical protein [Elusimicrobiota bacterium]